MRKLLFSLLFLACPLFPQTASFPSSVVTDSQLMRARNMLQTTLSGAVNASATSISVANGTGMAANTLLTIDSEIVAVCNVVGNTLTIGKSSCPNVDGRGFDGTSAASHLANATISGYLDAWHHNAVAAEIKAIEGALGANLGNLATAPGAQQPGRVYAGPPSGSAQTPAFRALVASDLPANLTSSTTGTAAGINGTLFSTLGTGLLKVTSGIPYTALGGTDYENPLTFSAPLSRATNTVSIPAASTSVAGYLSSTDWNTFNGKAGAGTCTNNVVVAVTTGTPTCAALTVAYVSSGSKTGDGTRLATASSVPADGCATWTSGNIGTTGSSCGSGSGSGDLSSNTSSSIVGEVLLFADTTGKLAKRATGSGLAKLTSGVLSTATASSDYAPATSGSSILKGNGTGGFSTSVFGDVTALWTGGTCSASTYLRGDGSCQTPAGAGDVVGPGAVTSGYVARWGGSANTLTVGLPVSATPGVTTILESDGTGKISATWLPTTIASNTTGTAASVTGYTFTGVGTKIATSTGALVNGNCVAINANGDFVDNGTACGSGSGSGTVTSVGLALPAIFTITVSPVTTTGSLTATLANQTANRIWAGPTTGSPAAPTFRALVSADIPANGANTSGNAGTATALAANGTNCSAGSYPLGVDASGNAESCTAAPTGTLASVALALPGIFSVSGSPLTGAGGTITATLANQSVNQFFAGPSSGGASTPAFRSIAVADLPSGYAYSSLSGAPTLRYQTVQTNGSSVAQENNLNFSSDFVVTDVPGSQRTTISLASAGGASQWSNVTGGIYYNAGAVGIGDPLPLTSTLGLKVGFGTSFNAVATMGTSGNTGLISRVATFADGTSGTPVTATTPSFVLQRQASSTTTINGETYFQFNAAKYSGAGFTAMADFSFDSTVGTGVSNETGGLQSDLIALGADAYCHPTSVSAQVNCYAAWFRVNKGNVYQSAWGSEYDIWNNSGTAAPLSYGSYPSQAGSGGIAIYSRGATNTTGLDIASGDAGVSKWHYGVRINDWDKYGIDMSPAPYGTSVSAIRMPNGKPLTWRTAANTLDLDVINYNSADNLVMNVPAGHIIAFYADNVLLGAFSPIGGLQLGNYTQDVCNVNDAGLIVYTQGAGSTKDSLKVCAKDGTGTYAFRTIY